MVFPVVMYGCESWTIKKAEHWKIDAFELCCWRRRLRVPRTARRSNQSILKEITPEYSLEAPMLKLKLQSFGHMMRRADSFEKTLMGKDWGREKGMSEDEMVGWHHQLDGQKFEQALGDGGGQGGLACCSPWGCKESDTIEWLNWLNWLAISWSLLKVMSTEVVIPFNYLILCQLLLLLPSIFPSIFPFFFWYYWYYI